jgi:N-acyl-L-homoserine lactone synthetase
VKTKGKIMNNRYRSMLRIRVGVQQERDKWEVEWIEGREPDRGG